MNALVESEMGVVYSFPVPVLSPEGDVTLLDKEPMTLAPDMGEYSLNENNGLWMPPYEEEDTWDWKSFYPASASLVPSIWFDAVKSQAQSSFQSQTFEGVAHTRNAETELKELIPALVDEETTCPVCWNPHEDEDNDRTYSISLAVQHLNDIHEWPREDIADWLETLPYDLTFQPASKGN